MLRPGFRKWLSAMATFFWGDPVAESAAPVIRTRRFRATARSAAALMPRICGESVTCVPASRKKMKTGGPSGTSPLPSSCR